MANGDALSTEHNSPSAKTAAYCAFQKQTFQAILFAMVHGRGSACAHLGQCTRHTGGNGVEERAHIRNQTPPPPKEGANAISYILRFPLLFILPSPPSAGLVV